MIDISAEILNLLLKNKEMTIKQISYMCDENHSVCHSLLQDMCREGLVFKTRLRTGPMYRIVTKRPIITKARREVLDAFVAWTDYYGIPPSISDIEAMLPKTRASIYKHLRRLADDKWLLHMPNQQKAFSLTPIGRLWWGEMATTKVGWVLPSA